MTAKILRLHGGAVRASVHEQSKHQASQDKSAKMKTKTSRLISCAKKCDQSMYNLYMMQNMHMTANRVRFGSSCILMSRSVNEMKVGGSASVLHFFPAPFCSLLSHFFHGVNTAD